MRNYFFALLVAGAVAAVSADVPGCGAPMIAPCNRGQYVTLDELYAYCGRAVPCASSSACLGRIARVKVWVRPENRWDRRTHRWIPLNKLLANDQDSSLTLEIQLAADVADTIHDRMAKPSPSADQPLYFTGKLVPVELFLPEGCRHGMILLVTEPDAIRFEDEGREGPSLEQDHL